MGPRARDRGHGTEGTGPSAAESACAAGSERRESGGRYSETEKVMTNMPVMSVAMASMTK